MEPDEEVAQLKLMIDQLKGLVRDKDEEVQQKNNALKETESKFSKLKIQIKAKEAKISSLTKQIKGKGGSQPSGDALSNEALEAALQDKENTIKQQLKMLKNHERKYTALQKEYEGKCATEEKFMQDRTKVEELNQAIVNKDHLISSFTSRIEELEKSLQEKEAEAKMLQDKLFESKTLSEQQKMMLDKLSTAIGEQEEKVAMVTEERSTGFTHLQEDVDKLTDEVIALSSKLKDKEGTISILEAHILQLKEDYEGRRRDLMDDKEEQEDLIKSLKRRLHELAEVKEGKEKVLQLLQDEAAERIREQQELQKTICILQQNLRETVESKELLQETLKSKETAGRLGPSQEKLEPSLEQNLVAEKDSIIAQQLETLQQRESACKLVTDQNNALREETLTLKEKVQSLQESVEKWQLLADDSSKAFESRETDHKLIVADFEETVSKLMEDLSELRKTNQEQLEDSEKRMKTVLTELDSQTKVLETQTENLLVSQEESRHFKQKLEELEQGNPLEERISNLLLEVEELKTKLRQQDQSKMMLQEENTKLIQERESLTSSLDKLWKDSESLAQEKDSLLVSQGKLKGDLKYATVENGKLQIRVEELEEENENLVSTMKEEEAERLERICKLQSENEKLSLSWKNERQNFLQELEKVESKHKTESESVMLERETRIRELVQNLERSSREKRLIENQLEESIQRAAELKHDLEGINLENKILISNSEKMKEEQNVQQEILKDSESENERLIREHVALEEKNDELLILTEKYKDRMTKLKYDAEESLHKNLILEDEVVQMKQTIEDQRVQEEANVSSWRKKYQDLESQTTESSQAYLEREKRLHDALEIALREKDSLTADNGDLVMRMKSLLEKSEDESKFFCQNVSNLKECLKESKEEREEATSRALDSESKLNLVNEARTKFEKISQELEDKLKFMQVDKTHLESQLNVSVASLNEAAQKSSQEITSIQDKLEEAESVIKVLQIKLDETKDESMNLERWKDEASIELEDLRQNLDATVSRNLRLDEEMGNLKNLLDEKNYMCCKLEDNLEESKSLQSRMERASTLQAEEILTLRSAVSNLEKERESFAVEHHKEFSEMQGRIQQAEKENVVLQDQLCTSAKELEKIECQLNKKDSDVMKKIELLEQMSTQYTSLRSELEASHTEYKRLMAEMGKPPFSKEEATAEVQQEQRQTSVESELNEAKVKLNRVESERDDAVHEATLLKRLKREQSHDFNEGGGMQFAQEPSGSMHKGGLEYLQSQLEGLANEQEQQAIEHQRVTAALNDKIYRITSEKEQLLKAHQKQSLELEEVFKSFDEKNSECQQLDVVISEQQRDLTKVREDLNKAQKISEKREKTLHELEEKFLQVQEKHEIASKDLESLQCTKQDLEFDLKETKLSLKKSEDQNVFLDEQVEKHNLAVSTLQQDLDQAMEQIDVLNGQYNEDVAKLKSLLRDKDQEIATLHDEVSEKAQEVTSLSQSLREQNSECSNLTDLLNAQTEKVEQLESLIRQREVELALISELRGEKEQAALKAMEMTEYIDKLEQKSKTSEATAQDLMKKMDFLQSELVEKEGALERLSRESSRIQESHLKKEEEKENCLTDTENQLLALKQQLTQSEQTIASLSSTVEKKDEELTHLRESCAQREVQLVNSQEELANVQQLIQDKEASFRQMMQMETENFEQAKKEEVNGLTQHLEKQIAETGEHHRVKLESLDAEIAELQSQLSVLNREKETTQSELFNSREEALQLREKVEALEKWETEALEKTKLCEDLENTCSLLNETLQESSARLRDVEQQYITVQKNLSEATEKATEKETLVAKLDEALTANSAEVRRLKDALSAESERQVKEMDSMMAANIQQRDDHIKFIEGENIRIQQLLTTTEQELDQSRNACTELEVEFDAARKEHELKLEEEARKHAEDLGALNSLLEENRLRLQEITGARKQDDLKEEAWAKTCSELESQLCQVREELDSSKLNLSNATDKEQELSVEISRLNDELNDTKEREDGLKEMSAKHEAQLDKAKKIVRGLQIQVKQAKQKAAQLEAEKSQMLEVSQQSSQQTEQSDDSDMAAMAQRITEMEKEAAVYKSNSEEAEMLTTSLKEQLLSSVQDLANFQKKALDKQADLQKEITELKERDEKRQETMDLTAMEKTKLRNELDDLSLQLQNVKQTDIDTEEKLTLEQRRNVQLASEITEKDEQIVMIESQLQSSKESINVLCMEKEQLELLLRERENFLQNLSSSVADGDEKLMALQTSLNVKDSELLSALAEISKYKDRCETISSELQSTKEQSRILKNSLKENIEEAAKELLQKGMEIQSLTAENETLRMSSEEKDVKIENLLGNLEGVGHKNGAELADLKSQLKSINDELNSKLIKIDELSEKCYDLERELNEKDDELKNAAKENENFQEAMSNKENEVEKLLSELDLKTEEIQSLANSIKQKSSELDMLQAELDKRDQDGETDSQQKQVEHQHLQEKVDGMNACLQEKDEENASLNQKLMSSQERVQEYEKTLKDAEFTIQKHQENAAQNDESIDSLTAEVNLLKEKLVHSDDYIKNLNSETESLRSTLAEKNTVCATLNEDLRAVNEKSEILERETERLKFELKAREEVNIENQNRQLLEKLKENDEKLHQLQDGLCGKGEELESANQTVSLLQAKIAELHKAKLEKGRRQEGDALQKSSVEDANNEFSGHDANEVSKNDPKTKLSELELQLEEKSKSLSEYQRKLKASLLSRKSLMEKVKIAENKLKEYEQHSTGIDDVPKEMNESLNQSFDSVSSASAKDSDKNLLSEISSLTLKVSELSESKENLKSEFLKEKQELDEREKELKTVNLDLVSERDNLKKEVQVKQEEIQNLRNCLDESGRSSADTIHLREELMTLQVSHEEMRNRQLEMESTRAECEKMSVLSTSLQKQVDASASMQESLKVKYERKSNECENLQDDLSSLLDEKSKLEEDLQGAQFHVQELENNLQEKEELVLQLQGISDHKELIQDNNEADSLRSLLNEQEERNSDMNVRISDLEHDLMKSKKEAEKWREECEHLQASLDEEKELSIQRQEEITNLKDDVFKKSVDIENLQSSVNDTKSMMEQETDTLNSSLSDIQKERDHLQEEVGMLTKKNEHDSFLAETEKIQLLQKTSDDAVKEKEQFRRKLKAALVSRKELILQEKQLKEELDTLKSYKKKYEDTDKILSEMKLRKDERDADLTEMKSRREKDIRILKDFRKKVSDLEKKDEENLQTIEDGQRVMEELKSKLSEMEDSLRLKESEISTLETCNNDLNEMAVSLEGKNKSLQKKLEEDVEAVRNLQKELKSIQEEKSSGVSSDDLEEIQDRLEAAEWDKETLAEKVKQLENEKKEKASMLNKVLEDFEQESIAKQEATSRCDDLQQQLIKLQSDLDKEKTEESLMLPEDVVVLQGVQKENRVLKDSLDNIEAELDKTKIERDALKTELKDFLPDIQHSNLILQLQEEKKALKASLGSLKDEIEKRDSEILKKEEQRNLFSASSLSKDVPDDPNELEKDVLLAKRTVLEETLGQLKVTQPENWEQEPGVKKLIDKLEYLADKAAAARRDAKACEIKCEEAEAEHAKMKIQWESSEEAILMSQKTIEQQEEVMRGLKERIQELEIDSEMESMRIELLQLRGQYDHLKSSSEVQEESYEQIRLRHEDDIENLKDFIKELENERRDLKENLSVKLEEMRILNEQKDDLDLDINEYRDVVQRLKQELSSKEKYIGTLEENQRTYKDLDFHDGISSSGREENMNSSSNHSLSSLADRYSKVIKDLTSGNMDANEMQKQHQALVQELINKEEELVCVKEELGHLSRAYDEMLRKAELPLPFQALESQDRTVSLDVESTASVEQENLLRSEPSEVTKSKVDPAKELASREALISELVSDGQRLKTELEKERDITASLQVESSDLRTQAKSLACLRTQYEANENHLKSELAMKDRLIQRQKEELDYSRMEQERLRKEFGAGSPQEVQVVLAAYLEDINKLKADLLARSAELEGKILRVDQLERESHTREKEIEKLSLEVESLNKELESYTEMVRNLREDLEGLMLEKGTLLHELEVFKGAEESLKMKNVKIQELQDEISKLMDSDKKNSFLVSHLQEDAQTRKVQLEAQSSHLLEKENLLLILEKEKHQALTDLDEKASLLEDIQGEISLTRSKFQDMSAELEAKDSALRAILDDKERLSNDMKKSRSEIMNLKEENTSLKTDMEKYKQEREIISGNFSSFVETNKDRSQRLEIAEQSLSSLTGELSALDDKHSTASLIMEEVRMKMVPGGKVQTEILVQSAQRGDEKSPVKLVSPGLLKDKNPWVRLRRKMDEYEDALKWMSTSKKETEDKNRELENLYRKLKVDYNGSESELDKVQSSLLEARAKVQESEMQREKLAQDAREEIERRERALEEMNAGLKSSEAALNTEKERARILESEAEKLQEQNNALTSSFNSALDRIQTLESSTEHIQHLQVAEQKLLALNTQLEQLLAERQQLGGQLNALHASLQDYQVKYANLHAEYMKIADEHGKCKRVDGGIKSLQASSVTDNGAPGGPPMNGAPDSPEHKTLQQSLHNAHVEKRHLAERLSQMEDQLRDEVQRRAEVEELLQNLRMNKHKNLGEVSLQMSPIMSDEEDVILLRPTSVTRKVLSSAPGSFARWLRGRSLRWANPSKTRLCPHFRPLSFQTLAVVYMLVLHILLIKCFFL